LNFVRATDTKDDTEARRAARHVLLGTRAAWFCQRYRPAFPGGGLGDPWDEVLLVKYVVPHGQLRGGLSDRHFSRDCLDLELVLFGRAKAKLDAERPTWPSWAPLLDAVREVGARPDDEQELVDALRWIVAYRRAEIDAARFHYEWERQDDDGGDP